MRAWRAERRVRFPDEPMQWRVFHLSSYQDDSPAMIIDLGADWFEETFLAILVDPNVPLSGKEGVFQPVCEAIGGRLYSSGGGAALELSEAAWLAFLEDVEAIREAAQSGAGVTLERYDSFRGRFEWVNRFFGDGTLRCVPIHQARRRARRRATEKFGKKRGWHKRVLVDISPDVIESIDGVL